MIDWERYLQVPVTQLPEAGPAAKCRAGLIRQTIGDKDGCIFSTFLASRLCGRHFLLRRAALRRRTCFRYRQLVAALQNDSRLSQTVVADKGFASVRRVGNGLYATISDTSKGLQTMCNGGFLAGKDSALLLKALSALRELPSRWMLSVRVSSGARKSCARYALSLRSFQRQFRLWRKQCPRLGSCCGRAPQHYTGYPSADHHYAGSDAE